MPIHCIQQKIGYRSCNAVYTSCINISLLKTAKVLVVCGNIQAAWYAQYCLSKYIINRTLTTNPVGRFAMTAFNCRHVVSIYKAIK